MALISVRPKPSRNVVPSKPVRQTSLDLFAGCIAPQRFSMFYQTPRTSYEHFANVFCLAVKKTMNCDELKGTRLP
jgi:hypothetical protein